MRFVVVVAFLGLMACEKAKTDTVAPADTVADTAVISDTGSSTGTSDSVATDNGVSVADPGTIPDPGTVPDTSVVDTAVVDSTVPDTAPQQDAGPAPSFAPIFDAILVKKGCTGGYCHGGGAGGLSMMDAKDAYENLVGVKASIAACGLTMRVVAGNADESILYSRVMPDVGGGAPCAEKMPKGSMGLTAAEAEVIRAWIAGGAAK